MRLNFFSVFCILLLFACSSPQESKTVVAPIISDFEEIKPILLGTILKQKNLEKTITTKTKKYTSITQFVGNGDSFSEINVIFKPNYTDSCFANLTDFYNTAFNNTKTDKIFNSWSTDSLEILLFKQTDSTILANIFIKTYR